MEEFLLELLCKDEGERMKKSEQNETFPFPSNVKMEFAEFCRGCKLCDLTTIDFVSGDKIYQCEHLQRCTIAYEKGFEDGGGKYI